MKAVILRLSNGWPMPLMLQGAYEMFQSVVFCAGLLALPLVTVYFTGGFLEQSFSSVMQLVGHAWLLIHGVPLQIHNLGPESDPASVSGWLTLIPLGLSLLPLWLSIRAGRRIARASYTDQLWQGLAGAGAAYAVAGLFISMLASNDFASVNPFAAALLPLIIATLGLLFGARREAGSWGRLIGFDVADYLESISPHRRWAGSYVWAVCVAGFIGYVTLVGLSGVALTAAVGLRWADVANVYQELRPGVIGSLALTLLQLGFIPNAVFWVLSWLTGGGFAIGTGSTVSVLETTVGPLPSIPLMAALPAGGQNVSWLLILLPLAAGVIAGWYFLRVGENHLDDWISKRVPYAWMGLTLSTAALAVFTGVVAGLLSLAGSWLSSGSLAIGRMADIGPHVWATAGFLAVQIAVGTAIGYLAAPYFETDPVLEG